MLRKGERPLNGGGDLAAVLQPWIAEATWNRWRPSTAGCRSAGQAAQRARGRERSACEAGREPGPGIDMLKDMAEINF